MGNIKVKFPSKAICRLMAKLAFIKANSSIQKLVQNYKENRGCPLSFQQQKAQK
ncbi:hypothetical protein J8TS2_37810 [Lederbergia ruris]|uniref:Uncharacterized protein n=1 Tax=Lederbergia ruris TaxID=217495 RepID=A0ABQ4KQ56_9BACI|nr:hypothetical protein J8TS2_37810 [Lederbergia ruris]